MNCQKETKTTLWEAEGWVRKRKFPSFLDEKVETLNKALCIHSDYPACLFLRYAPFFAGGWGANDERTKERKSVRQAN